MTHSKTANTPRTFKLEPPTGGRSFVGLNALPITDRPDTPISVLTLITLNAQEEIMTCLLFYKLHYSLCVLALNSAQVLHLYALRVF